MDTLKSLMPVVLTATLTAVFGYGIFLLRQRWEEEHAAASRLRRDLQPVLRAADDLVARIFGMIIEGRRSLVFRADIVDEEIVKKYLANLPVDEIPEQSSTVGRVIRLLVSIERFQILNWDTADVRYLFTWLLPPRETISLQGARFFLLNKTKMALRGNAARSTNGLRTEVQEVIGRWPLEAKADSLKPPFIPASSVGLLRQLTENPDGDTLFCCMWKYFAVALDNKAAPVVGGGREAEPLAVSAELASLAQLTVYLIDFHSMFADTRKWAEFRVCLVKQLVDFNAASGRSVYLYVPGDLGRMYVDTFPWIVSHRKGAGKTAHEKGKLAYLNRGAEKRAPRHAVVEITASGIVRPSEGVSLKIDDALPDLMSKCRKLFRTRRGLSPMR